MLGFAFMRVQAIALAALLLVGAGPASQPTTRPEKPIDWKRIAAELPKELRPPQGKEPTWEEAGAIAKWLASELKGKRLSLPLVDLKYNGGDAGRYAQATGWTGFAPGQPINAPQEPIKVKGIRFVIAAKIDYTPSGKDRASRNRSSDSGTIIGTIAEAEPNFESAWNGFTTSVVVVKVADAEPR